MTITSPKPTPPAMPTVIVRGKGGRHHVGDVARLDLTAVRPWVELTNVGPVDSPGVFDAAVGAYLRQRGQVAVDARLLRAFLGRHLTTADVEAVMAELTHETKPAELVHTLHGLPAAPTQETVTDEMDDLLAALQKSVDRARAARTAPPTT